MKTNDMKLTKEELIKFGKRLNEWGCIVPSDILDCAADEYLKEMAENILLNPVVIGSVCECSMEGSQHRKENAGKHCEMCGKLVEN